MEENTCVGSNGKGLSFFCDNFTYIASKNKAGQEISGSSFDNTALLPLSIFSNELSALEAVTKYLKEEKQLRFCEIAKLLNRDDRTIWDAYDSARKKQPEAHSCASQVHIPLNIFAERSLSMLESVTAYLKEICNLRFCHIATLLNKDARTIWTVYSRIRKKRAKAQPSFTQENSQHNLTNLHSVAEGETQLSSKITEDTGVWLNPAQFNVSSSQNLNLDNDQKQ